MSEKFWCWCPVSEMDRQEYDLSRYGFTGCAVAAMNEIFVVITFKGSDVPDMLKLDVAYRVYLRFVADSGGFVPSDIVPRLFPVKADEMVEAADLIIEGIGQISKYFQSVMRMNEYQDDIRYLMEVSVGVLDYFIGCLSHMDEQLGARASARINELRIKRNYILSIQMQMGILS